MKPVIMLSCLLVLASCLEPASSHADWIDNGVPLARQSFGEGGQAIASDGSSGAIIAFRACLQGFTHIVAQRVDSHGVNLWADEGIDVCMTTGDQQMLQIVPDGSGGAILAWCDYGNGNFDIYSQKIDSTGTVQWAAGGVAVCTAASDQRWPVLVADGSGGAIIAWLDARGGSSDIYAQRVNASGSTEWTQNGVALCAAAGDQTSLDIASDGAGGAIVAWQDYRNGNDDVYAQRVSFAGEPLWMADGVAVCAMAGADQDDPAIMADGMGGAFVMWADRRAARPRIYGQRLNAGGYTQWAPDGVAISTAAEFYQMDPMMVTDRAGGAIIAWCDYRGGVTDYDIYAQRVDGSGTLLWNTDGVPLCLAPGSQEFPKIVSDGIGGAIVI
jgi:hypothetical protein